MPDTSRTEKADWTLGRSMHEGEGASLREIAAALNVSHEAVRRRVIAEGWERDDTVVLERDRRRREAAQRMVTGNLGRWAERRGAEADEAGATARIARERALVALADGDHQMARAATGVYLVMIEKAQLLTGGATGRVVEIEAMHEHAERIFDDLAVRRAS